MPPFNGLRLPLARLVDGLSAGHQVRVLALRARDGPAPEAPHLRLVARPGRARSVQRAAQAAVRGRPLRADAHAHALAGPLAELVRREQPDVVHVFSGRLAGLGAHLGGSTAVLTALDAWHRNVAARAATERGWRRPVLRVEERNVRRFVADEYHRYASVVAVTAQDAAALAELAADLSVAVIPNGVDAAELAAPDRTAREPDLLVFHGAMGYAPNVAAARALVEHVLPRVRADRPGAHAALVGRSPAPAVRLLERRAGVHVTGEVDDVRPWLHRAAVYVCPMHTGTGIKNKLLEAMAAGVPVVATPLALQGLDVEDGTHVLVAEDDADVAAAVLRVLADPTLGRRLGASAAAHVRARFSWDAMVAAYEQLYRDVTGTGGS